MFAFYRELNFEKVFPITVFLFITADSSWDFPNNTRNNNNSACSCFNAFQL